MPYIVKSSLDIGGKIVPWNEQETNKLIKEKEEFLSKKESPKKPEKLKNVLVNEATGEVEDVENFKEQKEKKNDIKKNEKAGEK